MPRTVSTNVQTETAKAKTQVGYLIELQLSTTLRYCTAGTVVWGGYTWAQRGIQVGKITRGDSSRSETTLTVSNGDDVLGAFILGEKVSGKAVRIWSYYAGVANEGIQEFDGVIGEVSFSDLPNDSVTVSLTTPEASYLRSPRQQINAAAGFKTLLPKGTKLTFSNGQTYVLDR